MALGLSTGMGIKHLNNPYMAVSDLTCLPIPSPQPAAAALASSSPSAVQPCGERQPKLWQVNSDHASIVVE